MQLQDKICHLCSVIKYKYNKNRLDSLVVVDSGHNTAYASVMLQML